MKNPATIKIYNGYGHSKNLVIYGHVFKGRSKNGVTVFNQRGLTHALSLLRLFLLRPLGNVPLRLFFRDQVIETIAESDGFFKFKWAADTHLEPGLHQVEIGLVNPTNHLDSVTSGKVYVPHSTQYTFVSDIDDTILISHSATVWRRLRELLSKNAYRRKLFTNHAAWYNLLSTAHTDGRHLNPFFYVSSSEWNLYDYLREIFDYNQLPSGSFLLSHFKRWFDFWKTGKSKHEEKYRRISRLLRVFPKQRFVLIGDNSQLDPLIYAALVDNYPDRIKAVYIRNIEKKRAATTLRLFESMLNTKISVCLFSTNREAIDHAIAIGLIAAQDENFNQSLR